MFKFDPSPKKELSLSVSSLIFPKFVPLMLVQLIVKILNVFDLKGFMLKKVSY